MAVAAKIVETAISRFGSIDALLNDAGIFFGKPFTEYTAEDFEALSTVNLKGFLYVSQASVKQMLAAEKRWQRRQHHCFVCGQPDCRRIGVCAHDHEGRH